MRVLISVIVGVVCGLSMLSPIGFALGRTFIGRIVYWPAESFIALAQRLDLAPQEDAAFMMIPLSLIFEGGTLGALVGAVWQWAHRKRIQPAAGGKAE